MISTSLQNKELIGRLTRRLGLKHENHISRIAFSYSIANNGKLDLSEIQDSKGKSYSKSVFFGDYYNVYIGLVCVKYGLHSSSKDLLKYIKMHVDDGLESLDELVEEKGLDNSLELISEVMAG